MQSTPYFTMDVILLIMKNNYRKNLEQRYDKCVQKVVNAVLNKNLAAFAKWSAYRDAVAKQLGYKTS